MIGCLVLAFALCQTGYAQSGSYAYAYAQSGYYQQPQMVYVQPPVYYAPAPVYVVQPQYYGYGPPFGGISVAVGPRGGVRVGVR